MMDAAELIRIVDERIALARSSAMELARGTVTAVHPNTRTVMATLDGGSTPVPVTYPAMAAVPVVGDEVIVARRRDGWLHLLDVLGRDADVADSTHPDLATHDSLGLATDAELLAAIAAHTAVDSAHALTSGESWLTSADFAMSASANVIETITGPALSLTAGTWEVDGQITVSGPANTAFKFTGYLWNATDNAYISEGECSSAALGGGTAGVQTLHIMGRLVIASGTKSIVLRGAANLNASLTAKYRVNNNPSGVDRATGIRYRKVG